MYEETYNVYDGGAIGGAVETVYLTDSTTFRKYLGKQFDHEIIGVCKINNKGVLCYKYDLHTSKVLDAEIYDIHKLKTEGVFE